MLKRLLALPALLLLFALAAGAQSTTISATITDAHGVPYSFARVTAQLQPTTSIPTINGAPVNPSPPSVTADNTGHFSIVVADNSQMVPGTVSWQWLLTIAMNPGVGYPIGTGPQQFTYQAALSGSTVDLTSTLSGLAPALTVALGGGGGGTPCTTTALSFQFNSAGSFGCVPDFTFTASHTMTLGAAGVFTLTTGATVNGITAAMIPTLNQNTTGSAATLTTPRTLAGNSFNGSANVAFANGFIVQGTADTGLSGAQFLGALATGILKNTTSTGILTAAAFADVTALWTTGGTCNNTTFLRGDGSCITPGGSGTVTTTGSPASTNLASFSGGTSITGTSAATLDGSGNLVANSLASTSDGVHSSALYLAGNTTLPALTANGVTLLGNPAATNTAYSIQWPTAIIPNGDILTCTTSGTNCLITDGGAPGSASWSALTAPSSNLTLSMGTNLSEFDGTAATAQFFSWKNKTAAVVGTSQGSPVPAICGRAFHGSADVEDCLTFSDLPGNGNDAAIAFTIGHTGTSTGAVTTTFPGPVTSPSTLSGQIGIFTGVLEARNGIDFGAGNKVLFTPTSPTIASGFGGGASVTTVNGGAAFLVNVGTGGSASSGVITMGTASTGYACSVNDITARNSGTAVNQTYETATSTTSVTITNQALATGIAAAWAASDIIQLACTAY